MRMLKIANQITGVCVTALANGNKIFFAGNGGSAADSQHLAAELIGKLNFDRPPLAAISLTTDTSILTAIGNDYGFEHVFSRQIEALGKPGDVLIAISTSGKSKNILNAVAMAKKKKMLVIGKTGKAGWGMTGCDILYKAPFIETQRIQECHMVLGHTYCGMIEQSMFGK